MKADFIGVLHLSCAAPTAGCLHQTTAALKLDRTPWCGATADFLAWQVRLSLSMLDSSNAEPACHCRRGSPHRHAAQAKLPSMTMATGQMLFHRVKACNEGLTLSTARMSSAATGLADLRM